MDLLMEPVTVSAAVSAVLALVDWKKVRESLATDVVKDAVKEGAKSLLGR
jgi:hypothetical protein